MNVSIIIPAFNESAAIGCVVNGLIRAFPDVDILVIDDGSTDNTARLAFKAGARVIRHSVNRGMGAAMLTGIANSDCEYVLFCDADGQHTPDDVARVMAEGTSGNYDMVVGARNPQSHFPILRRPGKFIMKWMANLLTWRLIPDLNSGLRIIRRDVILKYLDVMPKGFSFPTVITIALIKGGHSVRYVPITVKPRIGKSTVRQWIHGPQAIVLMLSLIFKLKETRINNEA